MATSLSTMDPFQSIESAESSLRRRLQGLTAGGHQSISRHQSIDPESDSESEPDSDRFHVLNLLSPAWYLTTAWNTINNMAFASIFIILLVWASIFIYITFYFLYIPSMDLSRAIHLQFDSDCHDTKCSNPYAVVQLAQYRTPTLFAKGQQYKLRVDLNMPDSPVNSQQGMFMIKLSLLDPNNKNIVTSTRPGLMTYRSLPVKLIHTFFSWPLYVLGLTRESENLQVTLIEEYVDGTRPSLGPASAARIELLARDLQVYASTLTIQANLTGLRYFMVNWPILTAMFGIATIFAFLSLVTICSINRVVRDSDAADTEIIFSDDLISNSPVSSDNGADDRNPAQLQPRSSYPSSQLVGEINDEPDSTSE